MTADWDAQLYTLISFRYGQITAHIPFNNKKWHQLNLLVDWATQQKFPDRTLPQEGPRTGMS